MKYYDITEYLDHLIRIQCTSRNLVEYVYAADGRKLREKHVTAVVGLTVQMGQTLELTPAQTMAVDSLDYADNLRIRNQQFSQVGIRPKVDYYYAGGFMSLTPSAVGYPITVIYDLSFHSFLRDHQGNVRVVADGSGNEEQLNDYYPYGCPYGDTSTNQGFQPYKYNGKELDRVHGLDWYDYGARRYDPAYCMFTQMDPLAEQYPYLSPYVYCAGNPVRYVDPDGMDWYENEKGQISWTDQICQKGLDDNKISGRYLGKVVLAFNGSRNEKLGKGESLFGEGAVLAKAILYGKDGSDDITEFDGFTMSSDFKTFGAIDNGEYIVNYRDPGKRGSLSSHWAINNAGPVDCLDGINPNPLSAYSTTQKAGVYIHRSNNNGWAGSNLKKKTAVSTGCLLIVPSKYDSDHRPLNNGWDQFNAKLAGVKSFKLILKRQ